MAHCEFGQDRLPQPHALKAFELGLGTVEVALESPVRSHSQPLNEAERLTLIGAGTVCPFRILWRRSSWFTVRLRMHPAQAPSQTIRD
jgi:hypothetical protein